ncbi:MAG: efflux RND transporter periplasmic adaptor subunit [Acidobacteria bacterium]|nr:efflux RND transporter periplasmic adaptor subunit [Acidobacteriota bacterium]
MGPVPVTVTTVSTKTVPVEVRAIGNVEALATVSVKALVEGTIEQADFREGQDVKKGDLLFNLDERPFRATLAQLEANLARDQAELKNAQSQAERTEKLFQDGIVSRDQYDTFRTSADALAAAVRADQAAIDRARIDLEYCTIRSPIDGRTGSLLFHPGNIVKSNDTVLVVINQMDPIYVSFSVPEIHLSEIKARMGAVLPVAVTIPGEENFSSEGKLSFIDNSVDMKTGTIRLKATLRNQAKKLWPGQFVNATLRLSTQQNAVVIPTQAVQTGQSGFYVYVVKSDMTTELRPVLPGNEIAGLTVIQKGLQPGETVVTDGQLRLYPGAKVEAK